ncbi:hypothetical protein XELAEV_18020816mg [Xenopus laevis]|uniref:Uncharacterized protein n=1 Tax=Xenopus laevis TaxID=8355 RepID=A0A974HQT8_XENLA|nr:hypothetical protein XELAEV_18020816mg [Xenopus laevis]
MCSRKQEDFFYGEKKNLKYFFSISFIDKSQVNNIDGKFIIIHLICKQICREALGYYKCYFIMPDGSPAMYMQNHSKKKLELCFWTTGTKTAFHKDTVCL